jgi:TRAP-type C4-dicarboxylate transport system permease small subunit
VSYEALRLRYQQALEWLVIVLMAAMALEVTAGVAFRTVGYSLVWYDEVASILLAWLTFYGSALASAKRAHIGCPEVMALMPPKVKFAFRIVAEILTIAFFILMGWMGYQVLEVLSTDNLASLPAIRVSWVQSVVPISAALIVAAELITLPGVLRRSRQLEPGITGGASH